MTSLGGSGSGCGSNGGGGDTKGTCGSKGLLQKIKVTSSEFGFDPAQKMEEFMERTKVAREKYTALSKPRAMTYLILPNENDKGETLYYISADHKSIEAKAEAVLMARVTISANTDQHVWRSGFTMESWGQSYEKVKVASDRLHGIFKKLFDSGVGVINRKVVDLMIALIGLAIDVDMVDELQMGPNSNELYFIGLKNLKFVNTTNTIIPKKELDNIIQLISAKETNPTTLAQHNLAIAPCQ
jgi:hypothetical protein